MIPAGSALRRRAVTIAGHRTSVSIEDAFWAALKEIAAADGVSINALMTRIDEARGGNLSSAVRVYVLERLRARLRAEAVPDRRIAEIGRISAGTA